MVREKLRVPSKRSIAADSVALCEFLKLGIHHAPPFRCFFLVDKIAYENAVVAEIKSDFVTLANGLCVGVALVRSELVRAVLHLLSLKSFSLRTEVFRLGRFWNEERMQAVNVIWSNVGTRLKQRLKTTRRNDRITQLALISRGIIDVVMNAARFFAAERALHSKVSNQRYVSKLNDVWMKR